MCAGLSWGILAGVVGQVELSDRMARAPAECMFEPGKMELRGRRLLAQAASPCDSLLLGEYLVVQSAVVRRKPWLEWKPIECGEPPALLLYARAAQAHLAGDLASAEAGFLLSAARAEKPKIASYALQAAGAVCRERGDYEAAMKHLLSAYHRFPEEANHPLALLNLSAVSAMLERWQDVLSWTTLAERSLDELLSDPNSSPGLEPGWRALILSNRLLACMRLGAVAEAEAVFQRIPFHQLDVMEKADVLGVALGYLMSRNDRDVFESHREDFQALAWADSLATVKRLGMHASLFSPWREQVWGDRPWEEVWEALRSEPVALGEQSLVEVPWDERQDEEELLRWPSGQGWIQWIWVLLVGVLLFLNLWWMTWVFASIRTRRRFFGSGLDSRLAAHRVAPPQGWKGWLPWEQMRLRWAVLARIRMNPMISFPSSLSGWSELTEREQAFLTFLASGSRAKEFARNHQLSAGYVYNMGSSIRRKLQVPESVELSDWIRNQQVR